MKAVQILEASQMRVVDIEKPSLKDDEILLKIEFV